MSAVDAATERFNGAPQADYTAFSAPGVQVWAPVPNNEGGRYFTGTSFAAALVTAGMSWQPSSFLSNLADKRLNELCANAKPLSSPATGCGLMQLK